MYVRIGENDFCNIIRTCVYSTGKLCARASHAGAPASSSSAPYRSPSPPMPPPHDESPPAPPTYPSKRPAVRIGEVAWVANKTRDGLMSFVNMIRDEKMGPIPTPKTVSEPEGKKGCYVVATFHTRHDAGNFVKAWERWRVNSEWNKVSAVLDE
ncbi:hypothetical protein B0H11DRAFT_48645 [Mycena galericulata]|nr:hypothetical protein B0H11DRAFT_48645 [Mycena galericulata]